MIRKLIIILFIIFPLIISLYFLYGGLKLELKSRLSQILLFNSWNKTLKTGVLTKPWFNFDGYPIMRIEIPNHKISQIILSGTSGQNLAFAPAWHTESYLPKENKVTIISSHRDSHGKYIKDLELGEIIKIQDLQKKWHYYSIVDLFIIDTQFEEISMNYSDKHLILITCYPFDALYSGTKLRYIVSASKYNI